MNFPITLNTKIFSPAMLAKPGQRSVFHLMVSAIIGQPEGGVKLPTDLALIVDVSGSMGRPIEGSSDVRIDKVKDAAQLAIDRLEETDRVAIVSFGADSQLVSPFTPCNGAGKTRSGSAVWDLAARSHDTVFSTGLNEALAAFGQPDPARIRAALFLTDGECKSGDNYLEVCSRLARAKVTLYVAGLGVTTANVSVLQEMAKANGGPDTNAKGLKTSQEVLDFFADVQAAASGTVAKSGKLRLTPPNFVTVQNFELVTRCGQLNYVPADPSRTIITIGDLGAGDALDHYLCMQLLLPEDIKPGRRGFGKLELLGEVNGKEEVLRTGNVVVPFVATQTEIDTLLADTKVKATMDEVREMMGLAAQAREMYAAANTSGAEAAKHVAAAEEASRKTKAFNRGAAASALAESIKNAQAAVAAGNPDAVKEQAQRATRGFSAADRAKALAALGKK